MSAAPIRAGIAGYGRIAEQIHARLLSTLPEFALASIYDATPARRELARERHPGVTVHEAWQAFVDDPNIELAVIATPPNTHRSLAVALLQAGKHVLVEKPFALTPQEVDDMLETAAATQRLAISFQNRRWDPDFQAVLGAVRANRLGRLLAVESRMMFDFDPAWFDLPGYRPWRLEAAYGGGILYDLGPHQFDQLLQLVPATVERIYCETRTWRWAKEVDNHYKCVLTFDDGTLAQLEASQVAKIVAPRFYVLGEAGALEETGWITKQPQIVVRTGEPGQTLDEVLTLPETGPADFYRALYATLRDGAPAPVTEGDIRRTLLLIDAAYRSARTGQAQTVRI
jgi:predicted dehydrogenase